MNINTYVRKFGHLTFEESPFNEVDALILSALAYVNLDLYTPNEGSLRLRDYNVKDPIAFFSGSVDAKSNKMLFNLMRQSKRFRNVEVSTVRQKLSNSVKEQFYAVTYLLPTKETYISFRGTDTSILGWKEDAFFAFADELPSHKDATSYLNEVMSRIHQNFYVGGHSKGGNLAIYSVLYMNKSLSNRLIKAYSFDGPGIRGIDLSKTNYPEVKDKLEKYITNNDVIGIINNVIEKLKIVYSNGLLLGGHDPFYWFVNNNGKEFIYEDKRSKGSMIFEAGMLKWSKEIKDEDKELVVKVLFEMMGRSKTIYDLPKNAVHLFKTAQRRLDNKFTKEEQERAKDIFTLWVKYVTGFKK